MFKCFFFMLINSFIVAFLLSIYFIMKEKMIFIDWEIATLNSILINMSLIIDWKSMIFISIVSLISSFIMIYSIYYMHGEANYTRFAYILLSFIISMMLLIISPNLISLMLGWDGLGLTSYLLVIFYQNESSMNSGMITVLSNRVGDSTLLLAIAWLMYMGSYNFLMMNKLDTLILLLIFLSAITKSAQIPFSAWLPAAMAAPTPVSALVHSSTLVTAGVFLMIRFSPLMSKEILLLAFFAGLATMFMAGWVANFETDFKKVVALSTLSQLGLMFMILGLGQADLAFFHLAMHALFKSTLFMCAGFIIHNMNNSQDSRLTGSFTHGAPLLGVTFMCTNISLSGFPFMTGFYSKDMILETSFSSFVNMFIFAIIILATGFTLTYSIRVMYMISSSNSKKAPLSTSEAFNTHMKVSASTLFILSACGGFMISWLLSKKMMLTLFLPEKFSILTILTTFAVIMINMLTNKIDLKGTKKWGYFLMMFLPNMTKHVLPFASLTLSTVNAKMLDKGWMEYTGPMGLTNKLGKSTIKLNKSFMINFMTQIITSSIMILLFIYMMN